MRRRVGATLLAALLAGCEVGPDYAPPAPPDGAAAPLVSLEPAAETADPVPDAWWRLYRDPMLDGFLAEAFTANTDIAAAEANLSVARATLEAARAQRYPQTTAEVGGIYGRDETTDEILEIGGHRPKTTWLFEDVLDMSYEIDLFGHVRRAVEAADADAEAIGAARDLIRITVAAETTRAYTAICTFGDQLAVARHSLEVVGREAAITARRQAAGAATNFDVARAEALVAQVRAEIPPLEGQRRSALFQLTALLGRTPAHAPKEAEGCVTPPLLTTLIPIGDGAALLKRRPDIREAERRLAAATSRIGVATAELYPKISLVGLYGGASTTPAGLATGPGLIWGVGPSISWSFPNMTGPLARLHEAKADTSVALSSFEGTLLTALKETEQALSVYGAELDHRQALGDAQRKEHEAFDQARDQFAAGALSNLDLLTTEQALVAADAAAAASDAQLVQDQIAVFKALGGGWQRP
jgi:NodT family efflux transporter outer membrane factor (OMF) lipoprotein